MAKFEEVRKSAEEPGAPANFFHYTMAAAENAQDTIAEGGADQSDFDRIAMASLEGLLADGLMPEHDAAARRYFGAMGVNF